VTFQPGIPTAAQVPSQSQADLLNNFTALNTVFAINHLAFNAVDGGLHTQVQFDTYHAPTVQAASRSEISPLDRTDTAATAGANRSACIFSNETGAFNLLQAWAWVRFDGSLAGPITPDTNISYNVNTVTHTATGRWTITFTNALPNTNYLVIVNGQVESVNGGGNYGMFGVEAIAAGSCIVECADPTAPGTGKDNALMSVAIIGFGINA